MKNFINMLAERKQQEMMHTTKPTKLNKIIFKMWVRIEELTD